jgi:hypothetical protein
MKNSFSILFFSLQAMPLRSEGGWVQAFWRNFFISWGRLRRPSGRTKVIKMITVP